MLLSSSTKFDSSTNVEFLLYTLIFAIMKFLPVESVCQKYLIALVYAQYKQCQGRYIHTWDNHVAMKWLEYASPVEKSFKASMKELYIQAPLKAF